tara:strand:+ start:938 stop:1051 length:114 start_codon:yes stop_codon:yes gene_type:complete
MMPDYKYKVTMDAAKKKAAAEDKADREKKDKKSKKVY